MDHDPSWIVMHDQSSWTLEPANRSPGSQVRAGSSMRASILRRTGIGSGSTGNLKGSGSGSGSVLHRKLLIANQSCRKVAQKLPRDVNTEMVTKIVPVRAVDLSIGPFCTEFRRERFCDDDVFSQFIMEIVVLRAVNFSIRPV